MTGIVTRTGMGCERASGPVVLTFAPVPGRPYLRLVTCEHCGESWKTDGKPEDFQTYAEARR